MIRVELTDAAAEDVLAASLAYEMDTPGLGFRFEEELDAALSRVAERPLQYAEISPLVRRVLLHDFPYCAYFTLIGDGARVFAVLHQHRDPSTWKTRVP
ncbi:MAG TPA: hypothetical protein VG755_24615 [Nannocystaceae bacterium]|nr:hypothetical protein [Nannocystaceae bacterium]